LPALLVVLLAEAWLCLEFDRRHGWPWSLTLAASGEGKLREPPSSALDGQSGTTIQEHTDSLATGGDDNADENQTFVRRTREGIADGQRFLSGEIQLKLSPDERSKEVVIGFCPAFEGEPSVEFELTDERVSGNLLNCSPGGMRLIVRRNPGEQPEGLEFDLQWYAAQAEPVLSRPTSLP
jgi:hypothetical protein